MTLTQMQQEQGLSKLPACFETYYQQIADTWQSHGQQILSEEFILQTLESCYALAPYTSLVVDAARQLRQDPAKVLLVCLLECWIRSGERVSSADYEAPVGTGLAYDFLHLFPAIPTMPESVAHLRGRGVPEDVIAATMGEYDFCVDMCKLRLGRPIFDFGRLSWICNVVHNRLIRIGRLKYDIPGCYTRGYRVYRNRAGEIKLLADGLDVHCSGRLQWCVGFGDPVGGFRAEIRETEQTVTGHPITGREVSRETQTLSKDQWELCLSEADPVLRIHIPSDGSFDPETVEASYARAREIFDTCYPDYPYKAFYCTSWLMSPDLQKILKPTSNILAFQNKFVQVPCYSSGKGVYSFVFNLDTAPESNAALPEKTSLQRAIKEVYLNGDYIHEGAGFFF